jgi:hypothetical protein
MSKRLLIPAAIVALLITVFAIPLLVAGGLYWYARGEPRRELEANRALWARQAPAHYQYEVQVGCFCPREISRPVLVEVENGVGRVVSYADGTPVDAQWIDSWQGVQTMESIFDLVDRWLDNPEGTIAVRYDPVDGHPTSISIDAITEAVDDEVGYVIANLRVLP